jgi:hypothetical protein
MQSATLQPIQKTTRAKRCAAVVPIHSQPLVQVLPEEYMTSEEFRKRAAVKVSTFCDQHGIL